MAPEPLTVPPDDLDRTLSALFAARVPDPFPPFHYPHPAVPSALAARNRDADSGLRARVTLAASVALMVGVGWYLSAGPAPSPPAPPAPSFGAATADGKASDLFHGVHQAARPDAPMPAARP